MLSSSRIEKKTCGARVRFLAAVATPAPPPPSRCFRKRGDRCVVERCEAASHRAAGSRWSSSGGKPLVIERREAAGARAVGNRRSSSGGKPLVFERWATIRWLSSGGKPLARGAIFCADLGQTSDQAFLKVFFWGGFLADLDHESDQRKTKKGPLSPTISGPYLSAINATIRM